MTSPTAMEHLVDDSNLNHVYFFMDQPQRQNAQGGPRNPVQGSTVSSRSVSPSAGSSNGSSSSSSGSSNNSALNPTASAFTPRVKSFRPAESTAPKLYEVREIDGKGLGLFAIKFIPAGKRIICDPPLLSIPENALHLAWGPYCRLSNPTKKAYDSLHAHKPDHLDLEHASRLHLIDRTDKNLDEEDIDEMVQDQVRVMATFSCNNFQSGKGQAVFETASRLNHSCVPNVHHSFNPTLKKQTVHTTRDISAGEELCTTYLGGPGVYYLRSQRWEMLRSNYGFTCACPACKDLSGGSDGRRELMGGIAYGLVVFDEGGQRGQIPIPYVPTSLAIALRQSEDLIYMLAEEGILSLELCKAYRMASKVALRLRNWDKARDYALAEANIERTCLGGDLQDLVDNGIASEIWVETVRQAMVKAGVQRADKQLKPRTMKTDAQKLRKKERQRRKNAERAAEKAAGKVGEKEAKEQERAAIKKARWEAKDVQRKNQEYEDSFPVLQG